MELPQSLAAVLIICPSSRAAKTLPVRLGPRYPKKTQATKHLKSYRPSFRAAKTARDLTSVQMRLTKCEVPRVRSGDDALLADDLE